MTCVSDVLRQPLTEAGHDVVWTGDWDEDPGDDAILAYAYREGRVLVTLDKDFGRSLFVDGLAWRDALLKPAQCTSINCNCKATLCHSAGFLNRIHLLSIHGRPAIVSTRKRSNRYRVFRPK